MKHIDNINAALNTVNKQNLILSSAEKDNLSKVVYAMQLFAEATDFQAEKKPTSGSIIPIIDSLENALLSMERETPAINALCETLLNGLQHHFSHLLESKIHQSATALDPCIKLTFTDNDNFRKFFIFSSTVVKQHIQSFLPSPSSKPVPITPVPAAVAVNNGAKRQRLSQFSI